jgi:hypothetical protein
MNTSHPDKGTADLSGSPQRRRRSSARSRAPGTTGAERYDRLDDLLTRLLQEDTE